MYDGAVQCERIRRDVFDGKKSPMIFGEPDQWLALLIESLLVGGRGDTARAQELRQRAFEEAEPSPGEINGQPFAWIADADSRLGPVLEAVVNGRYVWVPFAALAKVSIEAPADLRDLVWAPAHLTLANGGETVALMPSRYAGSGGEADGALQLSRKTEWIEIGPEQYRGLGQRILTTSDPELGLLEVREVVLHAAPAAA
jgi:type VI secretion system protein ImpE